MLLLHHDLCLVADSLYGCQANVRACQRLDWKYILTLKEGRQPTTWQETIQFRLNRPRRKQPA